jgi:DNA-binding MarR family transcriptional regulator
LRNYFVLIRIVVLSGQSKKVMDFKTEINDQILIALRRIVRAIDQHSRRLAQDFGLTGPQLVILRELVRNGEMHVAELAESISLSHATVTDILNRLEKRGLVSRERSRTDRRRVMVTAAERALALISQSPPLLQETFSRQLEKLQEWELTQTLSVLQRVALMMDASHVDASPLLATGSLTAEPDVVEMITRSGDTQPTDARTDYVDSANQTQRAGNTSNPAQT